MVDLLISTFLVSFAVTYLLELLDLSILGDIMGKIRINVIFALPLSFGGFFVFYGITADLIVLVPAATFISLLFSRYLNKPTVVNQRLPRL